MNGFEKTEKLRNIIFDQLSPLIDNDYVLWDLPYHENIGDTLIWEGERCFLKTLKYKCLDFANAITCTFPKLQSDVIILLHGGGNFGDVWRDAQMFRLEVIRKYPNNKIILFPQTVHYSDKSLIEPDANAMGKHKNLTICARDGRSSELLKSSFSNEILLLPDMAFCISKELLENHHMSSLFGRLLIARMDKESIPINREEWHGVDIRDWPTCEKATPKLRFLYALFKLNRIICAEWSKKNIDFYCNQILRPHLIKSGARFIGCYQEINTTRLHVMILSILLGKDKIYFLDNNYGKCRSFYDTWLKDLDAVKPYDYSK